MTPAASRAPNTHHPSGGSIPPAATDSTIAAATAVARRLYDATREAQPRIAAEAASRRAPERAHQDAQRTAAIARRTVGATNGASVAALGVQPVMAMVGEDPWWLCGSGDEALWATQVRCHHKEVVIAAIAAMVPVVGGAQRYEHPCERRRKRAGVRSEERAEGGPPSEGPKALTRSCHPRIHRSALQPTSSPSVFQIGRERYRSTSGGAQRKKVAVCPPYKQQWMFHSSTAA